MKNERVPRVLFTIGLTAFGHCQNDRYRVVFSLSPWLWNMKRQPESLKRLSLKEIKGFKFSHRSFKPDEVPDWKKRKGKLYGILVSYPAWHCFPAMEHVRWYQDTRARDEALKTLEKRPDIIGQTLKAVS